MNEIQDLSQQIDFNNSTHRYKDNNDPKTFIGYKVPPRFHRSIKEGYITLEKAEEE